MSTSDLIKVYQDEYDYVEERIPMVQKEIDALTSDIEKLRQLSKDDIDYDYMMSGLDNELDYRVRLMDFLLNYKAQVTKELAILHQGNGDF